MEQVMLQSTIFLIGLVFGTGGFYALTNFRVNKLEKNSEEVLKEIKSLREEIADLRERISRLEGKINSK